MNVVVVESAEDVADNVLPDTLEDAIRFAGAIEYVQPVQMFPVKVVVSPGLTGLVPLTLKAMEDDGSGTTLTVAVAVVVTGP